MYIYVLFYTNNCGSGPKYNLNYADTNAIAEIKQVKVYRLFILS